MEIQNIPKESIRMKNNVYLLTSRFEGRHRYTGYKEGVDIIVNDCHLVIVRLVQYLRDMANQHNLPVSSVLSAVIERGHHRMLDVVTSLDDMCDFYPSSPPEVLEALMNTPFAGLETSGGDRVSFQVHEWILIECELSYEPLLLRDGVMYLILALIVGLVDLDEVPQTYKDDMLRLISDFNTWLNERLLEGEKLCNLSKNVDFL